MYCRSSFSDAKVDDLAARETVRDELGVTLLALVDQERIVVGIIESQSWLDPVLVQRHEYAEDPDTVAIIVVAVAADVGKAVSGGFPVHSPRCPMVFTGSGVPVPVLKADNDGKGYASVARPPGSASGDADHNPQRIALPRRRGLGGDLGEPSGPHICSN
jgi:hypothetical protein